MGFNSAFKGLTKIRPLCGAESY